MKKCPVEHKIIIDMNDTTEQFAKFAIAHNDYFSFCDQDGNKLSFEELGKTKIVQTSELSPSRPDQCMNMVIHIYEKLESKTFEQ